MCDCGEITHLLCGFTLLPSQVSASEALKLLLAKHLAPLYDLVQVELEKTGESEVPLSGIFKRLYDVRK